MSISGAAFDVTDPLDVAGRRAYADRANDEKGRPAFTLNQGVDQGGAPVFGLPPSQSAFWMPSKVGSSVSELASLR
jgi:hypothetical protein